MLESYDLLIDSKGYSASCRAPDPMIPESIPTGEFVHVPDSIVQKMNVGSGVGVDGAHTYMSIVTMNHEDTETTQTDFDLYCQAVKQKKISGITLYDYKSGFDVPIVAMRRVDEQTLQAIVYVHQAQAHVLHTTHTIFEPHVESVS